MNLVTFTGAAGSDLQCGQIGFQLECPFFASIFFRSMRKAKSKQFRMIFAYFCETNNINFSYVFASYRIFFARISLFSHKILTIFALNFKLFKICLLLRKSTGLTATTAATGCAQKAKLSCLFSRPFFLFYLLSM
jgi:hypothetical protein